METGADFGHNLEKITLRNPERTLSSTRPSLVQAKLTIGQPGDKYEQQANQVAATVVNQIHHTTIQKQQTSETTTSQDQAKNSENNRKQRFLSDYAIAKELVKGIDEGLAQEKILEQLLQNFQKISFKYTMSYKQGTTLLKGTREGDCKTLAEAFQTVAQEYFGIQNVMNKKVV